MSVRGQGWQHPRGTLAEGGWESIVDERIPGWQHTGLHVAQLEHGESVELPPDGRERIVVPLAGSFVVRHGVQGRTDVTELRGRVSVFDGPTDVLYVSSASGLRVTGRGRVAIASAPTTAVHPSRHVAASEVPVELRGAGASSRQVHNFGTPATLVAERLIVCEVLTPAGNWSSYPPHKHDEHVPGHESVLEEIYYFEAAPVAGAPAEVSDTAAFGLFSATSSPAGRLELDGAVRTGDIALVPWGYHGPAVAAPGYDLYYLNVMAGPGAERAWLISDDPAHAWVRDTWAEEPVDPRLPFRPDPIRGER